MNLSDLRAFRVRKSPADILRHKSALPEGKRERDREGGGSGSGRGAEKVTKRGKMRADFVQEFRFKFTYYIRRSLCLPA